MILGLEGICLSVFGPTFTKPLYSPPFCMDRNHGPHIDYKLMRLMSFIKVAFGQSVDTLENKVSDVDLFIKYKIGGIETFLMLAMSSE